MNPSSLELRQRAQELIDQADAWEQSLDAKGLTPEEQSQRIADIEMNIGEAKTLRDTADRKERLQKAKAAGSESRGVKTAADSVKDVSDIVTNPIAPKSGFALPAEPIDHKLAGLYGFKDAGDFYYSVLQCAYPNAPSYHLDPRLPAMHAASGLTETVGSELGWIVPPTVSREIWDGLRQQPDNLMNRCDVWDVVGESRTINANAETSRATGSRYGGVRGYWVDEAATITSSKPTLRKLTLRPHKLAVLCYATNELDQNSAGDLNRWLTQAAIDEINWLVGDAIVDGDGGGKPLGILKAGCLVSVAKGTNQAADTVIQKNIADQWSRMPARNRMGAVWLINQDVEPQLLTMYTEVKNVAGAENVGGFSAMLYNPATDRMVNREIIRTEFNPTVGDVGDVVLADMKGYALGLRVGRGIQSSVSMHLKFDTDETAFKFIFYADGQPYLQSALTPANSALTQSQFVAIAARA